MLFNSYEFIFLFLPIVVILFFTLAQLQFFRLATLSLFFASILFYSYWDYHYLPLLVGSILFNYTIGKKIEKTASKPLLTLGIVVNLSLLACFKYTCFFLQSCNYLLGSSFAIPQIVLPIGISFFTFTQLALLVDAYKGETAGYTLLDCSLFVTFFPHLIAGPILYHKDIIPQFQARHHFRFTNENVAAGLTMFILGLFKKVLIADNLAAWVQPVFDLPGSATFLDAWAGAVAYSFQLFFDFSGYSDMAIGIGLTLNVRLPINFNSPYKATSIIDFWRRWHITLSAFLKNYLYIPLGGNRLGENRKYVNILITMLLAGLWHGAGWTFVVWGGLHGVYLVINHLWRKLGFALSDCVARVVTFIAVVIAWVFFRAQSVSDALDLVAAMFGMKGLMLPDRLAGSLGTLSRFGVEFGKLQDTAKINGIVTLVTLYFVVVYFRNSQQLVELLRPQWWLAVCIGVMAFVGIMSMNQPTEFLYFQF